MARWQRDPLISCAVLCALTACSDAHDGDAPEPGERADGLPDRDTMPDRDARDGGPRDGGGETSALMVVARGPFGNGFTCSSLRDEDRIAPDQLIAELGETVEQIARRVEATPATIMRWQPWWLAPGDVDPSAHTLSVAVRWRGTAWRPRCVFPLVLDTTVVLEEEASGLEIELHALLLATSSSQAPEEFALVIASRFDAPELAAALELPPAAPDLPPAPPQLASADSFSFGLTWSEQGWRGALGSVRGGTSCGLLVAPLVPEHDCDPHVPSGGEFRVVDRDSPEIAAAAAAALARFDQLVPLPIAWPDGSRSTLRVELTPRDFACVDQLNLPPLTDVVQEPLPFDRVDEIVIPAGVRVRSADAKLDATFEAGVRSYVPTEYMDAVELYAVLTPRGLLERAGGKLPLAGPGTGIELATFGLTLEAEGTRGTVGVDGYDPYPGAPPYPDVLEVASNRAACFGAAGRDATVPFGDRP